MKDLSRIRQDIEGKKRLLNIKQLLTQYPIASAIFGLLIIILIIWGILSLISVFNGDNTSVASDNQSSQNLPADTVTYPEISGISVTGISQSTATINWTTDIQSTGEVEYWIVDLENSNSIDDTEMKLVHSITLTGLTPDTSYYFTVKSTGDSGYKTVTEVSNPFTTISGEIPVSPEVGYKAPAFSLPDINDIIVNLSDYNGKWVIVSFWETDCQSCRATLPHLQQYYETMPIDKISLISINYKNKDKLILVSQLKNRGVTFPVLLDNDGAVSQAYKITGFPTLFLLDGNGIIQKVVTRKFDSREEIEQFVNSAAGF